MTFPQPLLWHGDYLDEVLLGSVDVGLFVTGTSWPFTLSLWQAGDPPTLVDTYEFPDTVQILASWGSNDSGLIGFRTWGAGDPDGVGTIKHSGNSLVVHWEQTSIAYDRAKVHVSGDGKQIMSLDYATRLLRVWDAVTLDELWTMTMNPDINRQAGYVAGFPRENRVLWVNTSPLTIEDQYYAYDPDGTVVSGVGDPMSITSTFEVADHSGETINQITFRLRMIYVNVIGSAFPVWERSYVTFGAVTLISDIAIGAWGDNPWYNEGITDISDPGSGTVALTAYKYKLNESAPEWQGWEAALIFVIDNSGYGGGNIQLLDENFDVLDSLPFDDQSVDAGSWIGTSPDGATYMRTVIRQDG